MFIDRTIHGAVAGIIIMGPKTQIAGEKKLGARAVTNPRRRDGNNSARLIETIEVTFKDAFSHRRRDPARLPTISTNSCRVGFICERGRGSLGWTNDSDWGRWRFSTSCVRWGGLKVIFNTFSSAYTM